MDYAFVHAINHISALLAILLLYDIMCQFWVNFLKRIAEVPSFLTLPKGANIKRGIGLFHVHGHVKECFARFAPTFIQGAGTVDGEIIETLWNPLNHTASSARSMSWYHRQEYLDTHMGDSNWKKVIKISMFIYPRDEVIILIAFVCIAPTLLRKWAKANKDLEEATSNFVSLSSAVTSSNIDSWTTAEQSAQKERWDNTKAMDIFDVEDVEGISSMFNQSFRLY